MNTLAPWRLALRSLRRNPGFAATVVLILSLTLGVNSALFALIDSVLLKPLPMPQSEQVMRIVRNQPPARGPVSRPVFMEWREQSTEVFSALATFLETTVNLVDAQGAERLTGYSVSPDFWNVIGAAPLVGRYFGDAEETSGERVAVISETLWRRRFAADPQVVGSQIRLGDETFVIAGVAPAASAYPFNAEVWQPAWLPLSTQPRGNNYLSVIGRLRDGVSVQAASARLDSITAQQARDFPDNDAGLQAEVHELREWLGGGKRDTLTLLLAASLLTVLIACANLANLWLLRGIGRQRETAVRGALGADRWSLLRGPLAEAVLLGATGAGLGLLLAAGLLKLAQASDWVLLSRYTPATLDLRSVLYTGALALVATLLFALWPTLRASRVDPAVALGGNSRGQLNSRAEGRSRTVLVTLEVALALTVLVAAQLLYTSLREVQAVDSGLDTGQVLTARIAMPATPTLADESQEDWYARHRQQLMPRLDALLERLQAMPGVRSVGLMNDLPFMGNGSNSNVTIPGVDLQQPNGTEPLVEWRFISPDAMATLGVPLQQGRMFTGADGRASGFPTEVLVNQAFVDKLLGGLEPLGRTIQLFGGDKTIIGVTASTRNYGLEQPAAPEVYFPLSSMPGADFLIALKTSGDPRALTEDLRLAVREVSGEFALHTVRPLDELVHSASDLRRVNALLMLGLGAMALLLAALGLFAVIGHAVSRRRQEIGLRMSIGASPRRVLLEVLRDGMTLCAPGVLLGLVGAWFAAQWLSSQLFGVAPGDPGVLLGSAAIVLLVALAACGLPGWQAARVPANVALRQD